MSQTLTALQKKIMIFLAAYVKNHGLSPAYDEIARAIGITSKSQIVYALDALEAAGLVKRGCKARTIELLPSEYYHAADCVCDGCAKSRYLLRLKLVHALEVSPPTSLIGKLNGLRPLSNLTRTSWRIGFPYHPDERAKPRVKAAQ